MTNEQIIDAARAGIEVLAGRASRQRERQLARELVLLRSVLAGVADGQLVIASNPATRPCKEDPDAAMDPEA